MTSSSHNILSELSPDVGNKLQALNLTHIDRGILPSEMAAVCGLALRIGAERIIESGRWLGFSTETLGAFFATHAPSVSIDSIELYRTVIGRECEKRLSPYTNVRLWYGDAFAILPGLLERDHRKTLVLIDGPKGAPAVRLAGQICAAYPHVACVCIHDAYIGSETRQETERLFPEASFTDDPTYLSKAIVLDGGIAVGSIHPDKYSGTLETYPTQSYGPTLAVIMRNERMLGVFPWSSRFFVRVRFLIARLRAWVTGNLFLLRDLFKR